MTASALTVFVYFVSIFWFVSVLKRALFYVYLWQMKEYHIGRFADHFRTERGKSLFLNRFIIVKGIFGVFLGFNFVYIFFWEPFIPTESYLLPILVELPLFLFGFLSGLFILGLYILEGTKTTLDFVKKQLRTPVWTKKTTFLSGGVTVIIAVLIFGLSLVSLQFNKLAFSEDFSHLYFFLLGLILVDLLMPFIVSAVVLGLQPFTVLARKRILARARAKRAQFANLKVIGITGSYGKTSTKEFLTHILSSKYKVLKTPEHANSEVGVANTILQSLTNDYEVFVCEMGAYNKGGIKLLAEIAQPQIGIVTGVNEQHLATFGSMENLLSAEGGKELVEALPESGAAFVNKKVIRRLADKAQSYNAKCRISSYGGVEDMKVEKEKVSCTVDGVAFEVPTYGGHNGENLLGAIAVAQELGMSVEEIAKVAAIMPLELSPLKVKKGINGATVIDSTYSANPNGVIADLEYLSLYEGKKVLIMPCLIELGNASKDAHRRIGKKIGEVCDLAIITTKECFDDVKQGMYEAEPRTSCKSVYMEHAEQIAEKVKGANAILLEGGKESRLQLQLLKVLQKND
jgi:UDP-N-acetylmuramoyl-tripeptide--D-alanyl-D-alanine ligase